MGYRAETPSELLVRIRVILAEIQRETTLNAVFLEYMERLQKCVQVDGEYVGSAKRTQYIEIDFNREIRPWYTWRGTPYRCVNHFAQFRRIQERHWRTYPLDHGRLCTSERGSIIRRARSVFHQFH
jgi:hypothetical protein